MNILSDCHTTWYRTVAILLSLDRPCRRLRWEIAESVAIASVVQFFLARQSGTRIPPSPGVLVFWDRREANLSQPASIVPRRSNDFT